MSAVPPGSSLPGPASSGGRLVRWCRRPYTLVGTVALIVLGIPFVLRKYSEWDSVYVETARRLVAGEDIYDMTTTGYVYPPFQALLALPFAPLPWPAGRLVWFAVNVLSLAYLLRTAWRFSGGGALEGPAATDRHEQVICLLGLACGLGYVLNLLAHQQTDLLIGALLLAGCVALERRRDLLAGTWLGLAAAMKCTPLLWAPYLVLKRRWRAAVCLGCVAMAVNLLPDLVRRPPSEAHSWLTLWAGRYLRPMGDRNFAPGCWASAIVYNQSLAGAVNRWATTRCATEKPGCEVVAAPPALSVRGMKLAVAGASLALLAGAAALVLVRRQDLPQTAIPDHPGRAALEASLVLTLMLVLSPMSSPAHFCTLLLPGFCVARLAVRGQVRGTQQGKPVVVWGLLTLAVLCSLLPHKGLLGERWYTLALWSGGVMCNALFLLAGCAVGLILPPAGVRRAETPFAAEAQPRAA